MCKTIRVTAVYGSVQFEYSDETDSAVRSEQKNQQFGLGNKFEPAVLSDPICRNVKAGRRVFSNR